MNQRITNLPSGTNQTIVIDVRGQTYTEAILQQIEKGILKKK